MKTFLLFLVFLSSLAAQPAAFPSIDPDCVLEAIRIVEDTPGWGKHGEYGPYQMTAPVRAAMGGYDKIAAHKWLVRVCEDLKHYQVDVNIFNIALGWNAGVRRATHGMAPVSSYAYSMRVRNVYERLLLTRQTNSPKIRP